MSSGPAPIRMEGGRLQVPDQPIIAFIEGDGTGPDIWRASQRVLDGAVQRAYRGARQIAWREVLAGEKARNQVNDWLPQETLDVIRGIVRQAAQRYKAPPSVVRSLGSDRLFVQAIGGFEPAQSKAGRDFDFGKAITGVSTRDGG